MPKIVYVDRSRIESHQRCARLRWLEYHQDGIGITPKAKSLPLAVGGAVHRGLESLLLGQSEDDAVAVAVADLSRYRGALALDPNEAAAQAAAIPVPDDIMRQQLADSLGLSVEDAGLDGLLTTQASGRKAFDDYLWTEQSGLVEGMVRAYARRRLRPLLEEFEVLEVEREGTWELASRGYRCECGEEFDREDVPHLQKEPKPKYDAAWSLVFCSRPDALLRSRIDNSLYLMSFKTAASWDRRKELDAQHDMQGLSEGIEVERRLGEWWQAMQEGGLPPRDCSAKMRSYLSSLPAAPRILGIRYEYILKGERWRDKDLTARFGFECRSQKSHLVRRYRAVSTAAKGSAFQIGDLCWSYDYIKEDGGATNIYYGHWKSEPVDNVREWIDKLDQSEEAMSAFDSTVGLEPRPLGWKSAGQALGFTAQHPLDAIFIPPITVYRNDDQLRDLIEQVEASETRIAEAVAKVEAATSEDERRSLLNIYFPQSRRACSYPVECEFCRKGQDVCFGGAEIREDPMATGKFVARRPNHMAEAEAGDKGEQ